MCQDGGHKMETVRTKDLLENFKLTLAAGEEGMHREIITSNISRPGIEMTGCFKHYRREHLQLIGKTEMSYFLNLNEKEKKHRVNHLFTDTTPGIIITRGMKIPRIMIEASNKTGVPIIHSLHKTNRVVSRLTTYLEEKFAPTIAVHGVLVDVSGVGVLITGESGIGKSETALELIQRGHRLVADDSVEIYQEDYDILIGTPPSLIKYLLEIRGLGIINIMTLFGAGSVKDFKKISLIIHLEAWEPKKQYERLGIGEETVEIMDVQLPKSIVPVRPGRNLAVIIEVAAMNYRLRRMGVNTAEEFSNQLTAMIERENDNME